MCLICVEFEKERMTVAEARRALGEMRGTDKMDQDHAREVEAMLDEADEAGAEDDITPWFNGWDEWASQGSD